MCGVWRAEQDRMHIMQLPQIVQVVGVAYYDYLNTSTTV